MLHYLNTALSSLRAFRISNTRSPNCVSLALFGVFTIVAVAAIRMWPTRTPPIDAERRFQGEHNTAIDPHFFADQPLRVAPSSSISVRIDSERAALAIDKMQLKSFPGLSLLLHSASIYGLEMKLPGSPDSIDATLSDAIFDYRVGRHYFPHGPLFVKTRWGVRNRVQKEFRSQWQPEMQSHPGQLLCELAKHGVPKSQLISTEYGDFTVGDLLADTIAIYNHAEPEPEWNSISLILYLPPQREWFNKFGEKYNFDMMAKELLDHNLRSRTSPCYALHFLEALTYLLRADDQYKLLTSVYRTKVHSCLANYIKILEQTQLSDGSWDLAWFSEGTSERTTPGVLSNRHARVHITGHHIDWLLLLPEDLLPRAGVFSRSGEFLTSSVLECDEEDLMHYYCPYSHAGKVINTMTKY